MLLVWMYVWDIEGDVSPCWEVVSGLSWGSLVLSINIQELASQDTAGEESDAWPVLTESFQSLLLLLLLLASVVATTRVEVRGSVDRLIASSDLLLVSGKGCVCSVSVKKNRSLLSSLSDCSLQIRH